MADTGILGPEERVIEPRNYIDHHPSPEEVFLLIEVADRTLGFDRNTKATLYPEAQQLLQLAQKRLKQFQPT
jgi:hypothetical protein